jgi:carboxymethylenebutenolidase
MTLVEPHMMTLQRGADKVCGFLALPRDPGRHRAVIAMHEWWGLNDWVKEQATNLAANGYVVFAVDLYQGNVATNPSEARKLKRGLRDELVIRAMKASFEYLAERPDVDPAHIGSIGWSMGGSYALQLAIHEPRLAACVVNYGALPTDPVAIQHIHAQVLGTFGALDRGIPPGTVRAFEQGMRAANKSVEIKIYHGAGHDFQNPDNTRRYRPEPTADAWSRTLASLANAQASHVPTAGGGRTRDAGFLTVTATGPRGWPVSMALAKRTIDEDRPS